ncbi:MAG TPA: hypothetical protein VFT29_00710 [Gemmatimonadaceae bacterium]|nr:hypothetical protein [Gemmatimonadaceae bacterium]
MYSTCLFCNQPLGTNEVIEHFPVGRRLAFDAAKGRLWVVCRKCERWNLTPLEERWEAIEECERLFTATRMRVSTDNIGLAKLREGLELVRIGNALRPEMAAWRYGDQFGRRRRKHLLVSGALIAGVGGIVVLGPITGILGIGGWGTWQIINQLHHAYQDGRVRARVRLPDNETLVRVRKRHLDKVAVVRADDDWALSMPIPRKQQTSTSGQIAIYKGPNALMAAAKLLPAINESGAKAPEVQDAVRLVTDVSEPAQLFRRYTPGTEFSGSMSTGGMRRRRGGIVDGSAHVLTSLPKEVRIALEMASHEEHERRALEGELALLEAAWREAEEIAKIADDMFLPASAADRLRELKQKG